MNRPFVVAARLEAALKQLIETDREYLPDLIPENCFITQRDRLRYCAGLNRFVVNHKSLNLMTI